MQINSLASFLYKLDSSIHLSTYADQSPQSSISRSFLPLSSELTIDTHTAGTLSVNLTIIDDQIGLEDPEEVTLTLSVITHQCRTQISSFNQTVITILDNEGIKAADCTTALAILHTFLSTTAVSVIELVEDSIAAHENETSVEVCVQISTEIDRPLNFSLMTHNGSAKGWLSVMEKLTSWVEKRHRPTFDQPALLIP